MAIYPESPNLDSLCVHLFSLMWAWALPSTGIFKSLCVWGNIFLYVQASIRQLHKKKHDLPIPPVKKVLHLLLLLHVFEKVKKTVVKGLRVGDGIGPQEHTSWTKSEANLYIDISP